MVYILNFHGEIFMHYRLSGSLFVMAAALASPNAFAYERGSLSITNHIQGIEANIKTQLLCDASPGGHFGPPYIFPDNARRWEGDLDENPITYNSGAPVKATWKNCLMADMQFFNDYNAQNPKNQVPSYAQITITLVDALDKKKQKTYYLSVDRTGATNMDFDFFGRHLHISQTHAAKYLPGPFYSQGGTIHTPGVFSTATSLMLDELFVS